MFRHVLRSLRRPQSLPLNTRSILRYSLPKGIQGCTFSPIVALHGLPLSCSFGTKPEREIKLLTFNEVKKLSTINKTNYINQHGQAAHFSMGGRLKQTWQDFCVNNPYPTPYELNTFFNAAKEFAMDSVLVETLLTIRDFFPKELKSKHFLESRIAFLRLGRYHEMISIFEAEKKIHTHPQPIFYIWALTAYIELKDMSKIKNLLAEMKEGGYMVPNETVSRLMFRLAKLGDRRSIVDLLADLDPNVGIWTVSALNRTLTSLGMIGLPQEAFKFYGNSTLELDVSTFKTVLEIAVRNRCTKEATDILENRRLFDLKLDTQEYNIIIEALILLERPGEIPLILEEMAQTNTPPNAKTERLVTTLSTQRSYMHARNSKHGGDDKILCEKLEANDFQSAAEIADGILAQNPTPARIESILQAYVETKQYDKIDTIIESMKTKRWPNPLYGIILLLKHFCQRDSVFGRSRIRDPTRAFETYKAARFQRVQIWQPKPLFPVLIHLGEWEAGVYLFDKMLKLEELQSPKSNYRTTEALRSDAFCDVVRLCAKMQQYQEIENTFEKMIKHRHKIPSNTFASMWFDPVKFSFYRLDGASQSKKNETMEKFALTIASILKSLQMHQDIFEPNYATLDSVTNVLYYGNQRQALFELYHQTKNDPKKFTLPELTYQKLLQVLTTVGNGTQNLIDVRTLHNEVTTRIPHMKNRGLIDATLVRGVTQAGHIDEMYSLLEENPCGSSFRGALEVLLGMGCYEDATNVLKKMVDAGFVPNAPVLIKTMRIFIHAAESNQDIPIKEFLKAFEDQVIVNNKLVTKYGDDPNRISFSLLDVRTIYTLATQALLAAGEKTTAQEVQARMKQMKIQPLG